MVCFISGIKLQKPFLIDGGNVFRSIISTKFSKFYSSFQLVLKGWCIWSFLIYFSSVLIIEICSEELFCCHMRTVLSIVDNDSENLLTKDLCNDLWKFSLSMLHFPRVSDAAARLISVIAVPCKLSLFILFSFFISFLF